MTKTTTPKCVIDRSVLNERTVTDMTDIGLSVFASACGKNRGAFVLDPPDGQTYSCLHFPSAWGEEVGAVNVTSSNDISDSLKNATIASSAAVDLIDLLTQAVYDSSSSVDKTPYACEMGGLAKLECDATTSKRLDTPIRSVTLAGLLVPAPWATGGSPLTPEQAKEFYTPEDFDNMRELGLNTVLIHLPPDVDVTDASSPALDVLDHVLGMAQDAELEVILSMHSSPNAAYDTTFGTTSDVAAYAAQNSVVRGLILPALSFDAVDAARATSPELPLFLPANGGDVAQLHRYHRKRKDDPQLFVALDMSHSNTVAQIASSSSQDDRSKLFAQEGIACISRSPIEYTACYQHLPVFVASGFDLSIDNCIHQGDEDFVPPFADYGQCDRFHETVHSPWWHRHRASFCERQLFSYEHGMGWSFAAYKLWNGDKKMDVLNTPAKLMALQNVVAAGLFPSLKGDDLNRACLNPPEPDFVLGDETLAPTPGPPPDCGNGTSLFCLAQKSVDWRILLTRGFAVRIHSSTRLVELRLERL